MSPDNLQETIKIHVNLGARSYEIGVTSQMKDRFAHFVRSALDASWEGKSCRLALIVTDDSVGELPWFREYANAFEQMGIRAANMIVPAGERSKTLEQASAIYERLIDLNADRHTLVVAIGGGVIGDLAGFAAATYARGLPLFMIPTTLLAQVDSSVGGKVGVNLPKAKNIVGAFHQPRGVWIDSDTLSTLPDREYRCGLAEVVKYGVILDADFFGYLEKSRDAILNRDAQTIRNIVARSCELKAQVVSADEREETGLRAVLNFGHTIGHAIEAVAGYSGRYRHGEAVAAGMVSESRLAERIGWGDRTITERITRLLEQLGLPTSASGLDPDDLLAAMSKDKKNKEGKIRFVLPKTLGHVELTDRPSQSDLRDELASFVQS